MPRMLVAGSKNSHISQALGVVARKGSQFFMFFPYNIGAQVAGAGIPQPFIAIRRRAQGASDTGPSHMDKARRSQALEPWISNAELPSNKKASPSEDAKARKKDTPPHLEWERCHAICDGCRVIPLLFIIFNSHQTGTPSMQRYESGMPSDTRFSIRWACVFFGRCFFNKLHSFASVVGTLHLPFYECMRIGPPEFSKTPDNIITAHVV